ncbi:MAG: sel1 repeat family protein [Planctomycetes bacterium]|nr:sel1 repeat family protein [Planctomycetota bacterium]
MTTPHRDAGATSSRLPFVTAALVGACLVLAGPVHPQAKEPRPVQDPLETAFARYDAGDFPAALRLFTTLAEGGRTEAAYMAGLMHHRGRGTAVDGRRAVAWYGRAADANFPPALTNLGVLFRDGVADQLAPDRDKAVGYLRRAAWLEDVAGQLALAAMLINEPRDANELHEGIAFMQIAADAGDETARENLRNLRADETSIRAAAEARRQIEANIARVRALARGEPAPGSRGTPQQTTDARAETDQGHVASPASPNVLRLRRATIRDPMTNDCEALVLLVPAEWELRGGIEWFQDQSVLANPMWQVRDPRSGLTMQSLPYRQFTWTPDGVLAEGQNHLGMTVRQPIRDPAAFVASFWIPSTLPHLRDARLVGGRELPALAGLALRDWGARAECHGWRLRYEFEHDGQSWEEDVTFALLFASGPSGVWHVTRCYSVRGPRGTVDALAPTTNSIAASAQMTPEWQASWRVCFDLFVRRARQVIVDARRLAAALQEHREQLWEIQQGIERTRDESMAAQHRALSEALGGIETWSDPFQQRQVEMPQGYRDAWVNAAGDCVLSGDPGFDPNVGSGVEWRRMTRVDALAERTGR